jgi:hypothetical protein
MVRPESKAAATSNSKAKEPRARCQLLAGRVFEFALERLTGTPRQANCKSAPSQTEKPEIGPPKAACLAEASCPGLLPCRLQERGLISQLRYACPSDDRQPARNTPEDKEKKAQSRVFLAPGTIFFQNVRAQIAGGRTTAAQIAAACDVEAPAMTWPPAARRVRPQVAGRRLTTRRRPAERSAPL